MVNEWLVFLFLGRFFWYCTQKQGALSQKKRCLSNLYGHFCKEALFVNLLRVPLAQNKRCHPEFFLFPRCGYQVASRRPPKKNAVILSAFYSVMVPSNKQALAKKNAVILSPFYSRTGAKWQAGRPAGIKREKDLAELLRNANDQAKRGMPM